ncbi:MAG: zf-HC2 domain-containing protein [Acidobacteriota bacterium]|nr:zf-HC2 domain-containing protein [Acidobacteriota bacterium]MDQ7087763.1 zf-HC2 domain-containing protein [Acidobacteriota bacterium]
MTCREFAEFIADYLAGSLPDAQVAVFERHMALCSDCVNYLDTYRRTVEIGQRLFARAEQEVPETIPDDLVAAIIAARRR